MKETKKRLLHMVKSAASHIAVFLSAVAIVTSASAAASAFLALADEPEVECAGESTEIREEAAVTADIEEAALEIEKMSPPVTTASGRAGEEKETGKMEEKDRASGTENSQDGGETENPQKTDEEEEVGIPEERDEPEEEPEKRREKELSNEELLWDFFKSIGFTDAGAAAALGNLSVESGLDPASKSANFSYERGKGGGGLAGWMCHGRFRGLYQLAEEEEKDWTDMEIQMQYLQIELSGTRERVGNKMCKVTDIDYATDYFCVYFEGCVGRTASGNDAVSTINGRWYQGLKLRKARARKYYEDYAT
ncbi:MAG: phage tail tip lysozyme [Roseburia sp.]|nr:phage tail tip lysozyme [Roseburia sp.]MCM1431914.1 phage tail tip lysozyme [Muribaculaceae bacterium]